MERRPLSSRAWGWTNALASALGRRGMSADAISVLGLAAGLLAGAALVATSRWPDSDRVLLLAALVFTQARLLANLLDGMVAVGTGRSSPVGPLWNEIPDRLSDAAILVGAGYAAGGSPTLGWLAALAAVLTAYVRAEARACGAPNDFCGPMSKPQRMALVSAVALALALLPRSLRPTFGPDGAWGLWSAALLVVILGCVVTIARRLRRAARALRNGAR